MNLDRKHTGRGSKRSFFLTNTTLSLYCLYAFVFIILRDSRILKDAPSSSLPISLSLRSLRWP
jgi:hypothetical protein